MKKSFVRVALVALPVMFAAACGGDLFGTDGGSNLDQGSGACAAGVTPYRIATGVYTATAGTGRIVSDTCLTGLMGTDVEGSRTVQNDAQGNITLLSKDGVTVLGSGPVRCNNGTLTYGPNPPVFTDDGQCRYATMNSINFTVTSANTFDITVAQTRTMSTSDTGMVCKQPASSCTLTYSVSQKQ